MPEVVLDSDDPARAPHRFQDPFGIQRLDRVDLQQVDGGDIGEFADPVQTEADMGSIGQQGDIRARGTPDDLAEMERLRRLGEDRQGLAVEPEVDRPRLSAGGGSTCGSWLDRTARRWRTPASRG